MVTFKFKVCDEGGILTAEDRAGEELSRYAISPESTYAILDVIGNVRACADPIMGQKIELIDEPDKKPRKGKGKDNGK